MPADQQDTARAPEPQGDGQVPALQRFLDSPFILLFLGVIIPTVLYIIWGIVDIAMIPVAS